MVAKPDRISERLADSIGRRLAVVGQPVRIRLVDALSAEVELSVQELAQAVGVRVNDASQHLGVLRREGVVARRQAGRRAYYRLIDRTALELYAATAAWLRSQLAGASEHLT